MTREEIMDKIKYLENNIDSIIRQMPDEDSPFTQQQEACIEQLESEIEKLKKELEEKELEKGEAK